MNGILKASSLLLSMAVVMHSAASSSLAGQPDEPTSPAVPHFAITPNHNARGRDRQVQALAAELIGRQAEKDRTVPDGRARHFSWIKGPSHMTIQGWTGSVLDQTMLPSGLRVRVRVFPLMAGGICAIGAYTDETYLIRDGVAQLTMIAYSDPKWRVITFN